MISIKRKPFPEDKILGPELAGLIDDINSLTDVNVLKKILGYAYVELILKGLTKDELKLFIGHVSYKIKQKESNNV